MPTTLIVQALTQTAQKRRLLTNGSAARFEAFATAKGVATVDDARKWLASGDGLSGDLAKRLAAFLPPPTQPTFGDYKPLMHLADGGMGSVWLAGTPGGELVVVKTQRRNLPTNLDSSQANEVLKRFEREARITQQLRHDNVVRCLDNGVASDGSLYMVLEYVDSGDLKDLVERRGGLPEGLALAIVYQVVDGLAEAHRIHLIHRDIKPPNIFVSGDGRAKLADFGIARTTDQSRTMLTMEGAIIGSPLYMSPEQVLSDPTIDIRSDIYAMGAVLYFALAADAPYHGSLQEVLHKHRTAPVPDVRSVRSVVGPWTAGIVTRCMQKDRKDRYQDPMALRSDLGEALARLGLTAAQQEADEDTRHGDLSSGHFIPAKPRTEVSMVASSADVADVTITADLSRHAGRGAQSTTEVTLVADLRSLTGNGHAGEGTVTFDSHTVHTIAGKLLREIDPHDAPTINDPLPDSRRPNGDAHAPTICTNDRLDGDLTQALSGDWITLAGSGEGDATTVMLLARTRLVLGKLREAPVDVCVRNYPIPTHKEACLRVSRQHVAIALDAVEGQAVVEDLNAPNGTHLDGVTLKPGTSSHVDRAGESVLVLSGVVTLRVRALARSGPARPMLAGAPPSAGASGPGIDVDAALDAVLLT
nr:serine/threonine protein kinase [Planctomycetota bacterium]